MNKQSHNLLELDVNKLFVDLKVNEIVEIEKLLDAEIERKRSELRSMVGDRYKDILITSDSIKSMKNISNMIVESIGNITESCDTLLETVESVKETTAIRLNEAKINERTLVIQIKLAMDINEGIWMNLDKEDYLNAAQLYLLGQNIHTGLRFLNSPHIHRVPLLKHIELNLSTLKVIIFERIIRKLQSVELTSEQTCSNLNGLMLLQNQNTDQLISVFMDHRRTALNTVLNSSHSSVRFQISAMVKCLITTIHLLYDCFICSGDLRRGLIFEQLDEITNNYAFSTLSNLKIQQSPLDVYIPKIVEEFKPKCKIPSKEEQTYSNEKLIEKWLKDTRDAVKTGLKKSLEIVTNIKGLHIIREEALKIEPPSNWEEICQSVNLPNNFDVWNYFFQNLITERAQILISKKIKQNLENLKENIEKSSFNDEINELDLRSYVWSENPRDIDKLSNQYTGISMKAMGFSSAIVSLCREFDDQFLDLLQDLSQYLYGIEVDENYVQKEKSLERKFEDVDTLKKSLVSECVSMSMQIIEYINYFVNEKINEDTMKKTVFCTRLLKAITKLCKYLKKCCLHNNNMNDWNIICNHFKKCSANLWKVWINYTLEETRKMCSEKLIDLKHRSTLTMFLKWDSIEIQEQTDENVFKSNIKVPLKPSKPLQYILLKLNENLCCILPHNLPKITHVEYIESNVKIILNHYIKLTSNDFNQNQALQFLFDIKFLNTFCITRENAELLTISQEICDKLRSKIDPFDLDVFYSYLQINVKRAAVQSQIILGCLLPSFMQIANLEISERIREHEKEPSILAVSNSTTGWFSLLPVTVPSQKSFDAPPEIEKNPPARTSLKKQTGTVKTNTSLFGGLTTDWFS